mmetsp:Transcript_17350/g.44065  ORF Transcript_17350/g.44065 Transcript_17350/m.44065 type:complete len:91 (+) Transcript_17350:331-603(+)
MPAETEKTEAAASGAEACARKECRRASEEARRIDSFFIRVPERKLLQARPHREGHPTVFLHTSAWVLNGKEAATKAKQVTAAAQTSTLKL